MESVLEEATPQSNGPLILGEVPANSLQIGDDYFDDTIHGFVDRAKRLRANQTDKQEIVVEIPDPQSAGPHVLLLNDVTFGRDKENRQFFAKFKQVVKEEVGEHKVRDATIVLSLGAAALLVRTGLYYRNKK